MGRHLLLILPIFCGCLCSVKGQNPFEGISPGAFCFQPMSITGCNGSLLENYQPKARGVGINDPNTLMFLFTRQNPKYPEYLHDCGARLPTNSNFDRRYRTEIIVHGWLDGACRTAWMREMKDELLNRGHYNVILIDWTWGNGLDYFDGATNTPVVGEQIAFLVNNLIRQVGIDAGSVHIVGHSFGSHIAGFAGQRITGLGRITGLDPALAGFRNASVNNRLDPTDARLVDNIHSGIGDCAILLNIGDGTPLGHADFYPNGGAVQESCIPYIVESLLKVDFLYAPFTFIPTFCNHLHSVQYYKVSINSCGCEFVGVECAEYGSFQNKSCRSCGQDGSKCAVMGMNFDEYFSVKDDQYHKYYLDTGLLCPYCDNSGVNLQGFRTEKKESISCKKETPTLLPALRNI